jgi:hypothetical protein
MDFVGDFSKTINLRKKKKKLLCAFMCVFLGLKKPGDFTVSEGHGYSLVYLI